MTVRRALFGRQARLPSGFTLNTTFGPTLLGAPLKPEIDRSPIEAPQTSDSLEAFLRSMPQLSKIVAEASAQKRSLVGYSVFLVHHLTAEVVGLIVALRSLGCLDISVVFVDYNQDAIKLYRPALDAIDNTELCCYILSARTLPNDSTGTAYVVDRSFIKQPPDEPKDIIDQLDEAMKSRQLDFFSAMRALVITVTLAQLARTRRRGDRLLYVEDGGYGSPLINDGALEGISIQQLRARNFAAAHPDADALLPSELSEALANTLTACVEHTRSGYNELDQVYRRHGRLFRPAYTIALSYLKTQIESSTVASSVLTAIEAVLYACGRGLNDRQVFVFGSRGNIGRRVMRQLIERVEEYRNEVVGCDLKVTFSEAGAPAVPPWQHRASQSSAGGASEVETYADLDEPRRRELDLIVGVTGGPTDEHPVLQVTDVIRWLLEGNTRELFIASGSTKTKEFPELLLWLQQMFDQQGSGSLSVSVMLGQRRAIVSKVPLLDGLSSRSFGTRYEFSIAQGDDEQRLRSVVLMNNLMPVNFLFYAVPTEVIDHVLAQLMSVSLVAVAAAGQEKCEILAVDYDPAASRGVYGALVPYPTASIPLPVK